MEPLLVLLGLYLFAVLIIQPFWAIIRVRGLARELDAVQHELRFVRGELQALRAAAREAAPAGKKVAPAETRAAGVAAPSPAPEVVAPAPPVAPPAPFWTAPEVAAPLPPPLPGAVAEPTWAEEKIPDAPFVAEAGPVRAPINWEQFMGAKLFAWLGGLALFLGVAFFVKYSFEHDLVPPEVRVALGFLLGAGLVVGGLRLSAARYRVTSHTLLATGVVSLYAVAFACNSIYHFRFFGPAPTFLVMALITVTAFVLAVRLEAQVVAILGLLGGFLTPVLLSPGADLRKAAGRRRGRRRARAGLALLASHAGAGPARDHGL